MEKLKINIELRTDSNDLEMLQKWIDFIAKQKEHNIDCTLNIVVEDATYQDFLK